MITELKDFVLRMGQALLDVGNLYVEKLKVIFDTLQPYQRFELLHPRKKPRGSIRRERRDFNDSSLR